VTRSGEIWVFLGGAVLLLLLAANMAVNTGNIQRVREQAEIVAHTQAVNAALAKLLSDLKDAETGQRGYLITGNPRYLDPYKAALAAVDPDLREVAMLVAGSPEQESALERLRQHVRGKLVELERTLALRDAKGFDAARNLVESDVGKVEMDRAREIVAEMSGRETRLLAERQSEADYAYRRALVSAIAGGLIACAVVAAFLVLLRRYLNARERTTLQIAQQRELLQTTLASIGDGVITTDPVARVTFLNPVAETLTGWRNDEARGVDLTRVFRIVNEYTREAVENPAIRALREGVIVGLANHTLLISQDGTERPIADSAAPIRVGETLFGCVLVFRDVTERARLDAELKTADRRKDEFLATLAHELRNPLAPISNALFILGHADAPRASLETALATMQRQVKQMVRLIDDLLDVGRIRLGKIALSPRRVAIAEAIEQAVETVSPMVSAARHELQVVLPNEPVYVDADPIRLAQIFSNLLNNAAKFTPAGGHISLTVSVEGARVEVRVKDDGIGIEPRHLEDIFGLFSQLDQSLERSNSGLGIGLSLVRRLVELHGGTVVAQSEGAGHGTEFVVRLPLAGDAAAPARGGETQALPQAARKRRVLVVDDNRDGAESLRMIVELLGHDARVAYDGASSLAAAEELHPEVVFLDIGMPGMNGYDLCRAMRATPWGRHALIVALTGWGQDQDRKRADEAGFDRHVVKPISEEDVRRLCDGARAAPG
jgi:PAS domain S-box-containing protein